jgi:hypothetical protein
MDESCKCAGSSIKDESTVVLHGASGDYVARVSQPYGLGTTDPRSVRGAASLISLVHVRIRMYALPRPGPPGCNPKLLLNKASAKDYASSNARVVHWNS